ncbi:hypothetical protein [Aureicoccus marinus]|uniref:Uncharacterized protein n=1 Tax=Aureicoccus marinus TaxID=754435 RepID=A0A2S7T3X2_9FLAO|nr:hypothetical protein [Aureicoccus marinus]PQJ14622.1 hypothetical protein BST99_01635 [Aureicoccus marinus]
MKKVSIVLAAAAMLSFSQVSATPNPTEDPGKRLTQEIHGLLKENNFAANQDVVAQVRFMINKEGEIVIVTVDSADENVALFVKGRLNYQKIDTEGLTKGQMYSMPLRITA